MKNFDLTGFALAQKPLDGCKIKSKKHGKLRLDKFPASELALNGVRTSELHYCNTPQRVPQALDARVRDLIGGSIPPPPKPVKVLQGLSKSATSVRQINEVAALTMDALTLCVMNGKVYIFEEPIWKELSPSSLVLTLRQHFCDREIVTYLNEKSARDILASIRDTPRLQRTQDDMPTPPHILPCQDGLLDLHTGEVVHHPSEFFFTSALNLATYEIGNGPHYYTDILVSSIAGGNQQILERLWEVLGVIISGYFVKAFFVFLGPPHSGKTQLIRVLVDLIGPSDVIALTKLSELGNTFTLSAVMGKRMCCCSDVPKAALTADVVATLKQFVGDDLVSGDIKFGPHVSFENHASFVLGSNFPLRIFDPDDDAFTDRIVTVPFQCSVSPSQRVERLYEKLRSERGYIAGKAIEGLRRLIDNDFIFTPVDCIGYENAIPVVNPADVVDRFVEDCCILDKEAVTPSGQLYQAYAQYCRDNEVAPIKDFIFSRTLHSLYPALKAARSSCERRISGICLGKVEALGGEENGL